MNGWIETQEQIDERWSRMKFEADKVRIPLMQITEADADKLHELIELCDTDPAHIKIVTVTKRPTYDELIHGAKFTDEHRAELRDWWNKKYDNREEAKRLNVLR